MCIFVKQLKIKNMRQIEKHEEENLINLMNDMGPDDLISNLERTLLTAKGKDKEDALIFLEFALSL
jgi:hypothetical protein